MRKISTSLFCIIFLITKGYGQHAINHELTESITASILKVIDSAFNYREYTNENNQEYSGVRIVDQTETLMQSQSWEYLTKINNTPYVVLHKFPYNFNIHRYCDIIIVASTTNGNIIKIDAFSLIYQSCEQLPIFIRKKYVIKEGKIYSDHTENLRRLDNWNPYQNNLPINIPENK